MRIYWASQKSLHNFETVLFSKKCKDFLQYKVNIYSNVILTTQF